MSRLGPIFRRNACNYCRAACNFDQVRKISSIGTPNQQYCCCIESVRKAVKNIKPYVRRTPIVTSSFFDQLAGRRTVFKTENMQTAGSYRSRGATNAIVNLKKNRSSPNCIMTHDSGNHGQAVAKAAQNLRVPCYAVMPRSSSQNFATAIAEYGAKIIHCPDSEKGSSEVGTRIIREHNAAFIHPSQNDHVIAGNGTLGIEILEQDAYVDSIIVPVDDGGLIAGIALAAKHINPSVTVIAAQMKSESDVETYKRKSFLGHHQSVLPDEALIKTGPRTWPLIRDFVDDVIMVTEKEIKDATILVWERLKLVVEPMSGVAVAALLSKDLNRVRANHVAVVLCGGNVDLSSFLLSYY